ncbi:MAG: hypothetical protein KAS32_25695 [Candidatus Peribacteraceae bacterium]|nr:hypothetical protein [Candidatus Peribacteraceae bacterium]
MKGLSMISGVLFMAFIISATAIVYWTALPTIQKMQCAATMDKMKSSFTGIDEIIQKVSSEGEGSKRTINLNIEDGELYISAENDSIYWTYECDAPIFSPRTSQRFGNIVMGSNLDTSAHESTCQGVDAFILENEHLKVCLKKIGEPGNNTYYNITDVLISVYQKDLGVAMPLEYLEITLDNNDTSKTGNGYTALTNSGQHLPFGEVTAYMESDYGITYSIKFILESGEDFIIIRGE